MDIGTPKTVNANPSQVQERPVPAENHSGLAASLPSCAIRTLPAAASASPRSMIASASLPVKTSLVPSGKKTSTDGSSSVSEMSEIRSPVWMFRICSSVVIQPTRAAMSASILVYLGLSISAGKRP